MNSLLNQFSAQIDLNLRYNWRIIAGDGSINSSWLLNMYLIPYLLRIISVDLRHINIHALKENEQKVLNRTVSIMSSYGLQFLQTKENEGTYTFLLNPYLN